MSCDTLADLLPPPMIFGDIVPYPTPPKSVTYYFNGPLYLVPS